MFKDYVGVCVCAYTYICIGNHPELDRIWDIEGTYWGSLKDHTLSTPGWLYTNIYTHVCRYIYIYIYICTTIIQ